MQLKFNEFKLSEYVRICLRDLISTRGTNTGQLYWNLYARNIDIYYSNERLLSQSDHRDLPGDLSRNLEETLFVVYILASLLSSSEKRFEKMWSFPWLSPLIHGTLFVEQLSIVDIALIHLLLDISPFSSTSNIIWRIKRWPSLIKYRILDRKMIFTI